MFRKMVWGDEKKHEVFEDDADDENAHKLKMRTEKFMKIIKNQQTKYAAHIVRQPNSSETKQLLFNKNRKPRSQGSKLAGSS